MLRNLLRIVAGVIGFCLIWPGSWAIIGLINYYSTPRDTPWPLFDMVAMWCTTVAIWGTSFSFIWFAVKKTTVVEVESIMPHEIVPPEPHSTVDLGKAWEYVPRWLQIVLAVICVAAMLTAFLLR